MAKVNIELVGVDCVTEDEIITAAKDADAIVTTRSHMTRRIMERLPKCKVILRDGVGFNTVDVDAATDNNIILVNCPSPEWCVEEVSNHVILMLLACAKKLVFLNNSTKQGRWAELRGNLAPMGSIYGQTLGLIGCGDLGRLTAKEHGITLVSLPELLKESDFVSVHTILNKETWHLLGEREFKQMKPTAYFINTARGPIVDEAALVKALQEKWIAGAGLDVFEKEPIDPDNPLLEMDNVVVTPHSAFYSDVSRSKQLRLIVLQEAIRVRTGQWPKNVLNKGVRPKVNLVKEN